jgi:hypothetical protein
VLCLWALVSFRQQAGAVHGHGGAAIFLDQTPTGAQIEQLPSVTLSRSRHAQAGAAAAAPPGSRTSVAGLGEGDAGVFFSNHQSHAATLKTSNAAVGGGAERLAAANAAAAAVAAAAVQSQHQATEPGDPGAVPRVGRADTVLLAKGPLQYEQIQY